MRTLFSALLALAGLAMAACAPTHLPAREPAIWRIADADSEIWLFGSVHVLPSDVRWRGPRVTAAFNAAEEFITETDTSDEAAAEFGDLARRYGQLSEGVTLSSLITGADDRARYARVTADLGVDPASLEHERPWLASLQLSYSYAAREGHGAGAGVEGVLAAEARAQAKELSYFETPEQQVRVLADLAPADELRFFLTTLREIEEEGDTLDAMDEAWASGDVATLQRLLDSQWQEGGDAVYEAIVLRRNRAWASEIEHRLSGSGRIFIAVGAAHLIGDGSVVALLRARGIPVEGP